MRLMLFWQKEIEVFRSIFVQLGVELVQWTTHQKKIIVGNANEMKNTNIFWMGPIIDVLLRKWFPLDAKVIIITNWSVAQP